MKNRITAIIAALLCFVMLASLVACNKGNNDEGNGDTPAVTTTAASTTAGDPVDDVTTTEANVEDEEPEETETGLQFADDKNDLGFGEIAIAP